MRRHSTSIYKALPEHVHAVHEEIVKRAKEREPFQLTTFLDTRELASGDQQIVATRFHYVYGATARTMYRRLLAEAREKAGGTARSSTVAEQAEALRRHLDSMVERGEHFRKRTVADFLVALGARCDKSVRANFTARHGRAPYDYYLDALAERVRALLAELPGRKCAWLVLKTGATEIAVRRALQRLTLEEQAA